MNTERDKFLTQEVLGQCWHSRPINVGGFAVKWQDLNPRRICENCSEDWDRLPKYGNGFFSCDANPDFSTPYGMHILLRAIVGKEWWGEFSDWIYFGHEWHFTVDCLWMMKQLAADPGWLADRVFEYLKGR